MAIDARSLLCAQPRGEGRSLLRLYAEVARLRPDISLVLFGDGSAPAYRGPLPDGAQARVLAWPDRRHALWDNLYFPLAARCAGCTVMHCTGSGAPWRCGMPMLLTVHDLVPLLFDDGHDARQRREFGQRLRRGLRQATRVFAVSAHTAQDIASSFPAAAPKVSVMHWGADGDGRGPPAGDDPPHLLAFGGEAPRKNTEYMLERFIAAAPRLPAMRLHIVGINSPRQRAALSARVDAAGLQARVQLHGFIDDAALDALLSRATALLYLSLYEGFGLPLLEAIGRGVPVIASDRTSVAEVLAGVPGTYALDAPAAIEAAIVDVADPARRQALATSQAAVLPRFRWPRAALQLVQALDDAVSRSR